MWLRLVPPVTTEHVDATDGLVQLYKIRLPSAFGSGSHGGAVAADAGSVSKGTAIAATMAVAAPIAAGLVIRTKFDPLSVIAIRLNGTALLAAICRSFS